MKKKNPKVLKLLSVIRKTLLSNTILALPVMSGQRTKVVLGKYCNIFDIIEKSSTFFGKTASSFWKSVTFLVK